jgi:hypothetical protein
MYILQLLMKILIIGDLTSHSAGCRVTLFENIVLTNNMNHVMAVVIRRPTQPADMLFCFLGSQRTCPLFAFPCLVSM